MVYLITGGLGGEWDPSKAGANFSKHGVDFERAAEVFRDPLALTIPDDEHGITEVRWITRGKDARGQSILVVHTFEQIDDETARIRIIFCQAVRDMGNNNEA